MGIHLVRVTKREPGHAATLDEARTEVVRDFEHDRGEKGRTSFYQRILSNYSVRIEGAASDAPDGPAK